MEQSIDDVDEFYNQQLGAVLNFFTSKLQLYYSSSRLTWLLTLLDIPDHLRRSVGFRATIIPLSSRLKMMDSDALSLSYCPQRIHRDIFRNFLDSDHPLALDGQRHAIAASACLKIIFKHYQVPLSSFQQFSRHSLTSRLSVDMEHLSHRRDINLPGLTDFLNTYFSCDTRRGIPAIYAILDIRQRLRSNHLQFLLEKSAYSDSLLNFARRRVFRFGYLHRKHSTYMKKAIYALAKYIQRVTGGTAEVRACESIWGGDRWFTTQ